MCSAVEPEACHSLGPELRRQEKLLLPLQGVARGSETIENTSFSHFFGPPGTGALRASDATSFSAAAPENGPFLAFWYSRCRIARPLFQEKKGGVKETNNDVFRPEPKLRFLHMCTDGKAETVARIELKPARAKIATANCIKVRKLCMYVMI